MIFILLLCGFLYVDAGTICSKFKGSKMKKDTAEKIGYKFNIDEASEVNQKPNVSITFTWKLNKDLQFDALRYSVGGYEGGNNKNSNEYPGDHEKDDVANSSSENCSQLLSGKMRKFTEKELDVICDSTCYASCKRSICKFKEFQPLPEESTKTHSLTVPGSFTEEFFFRLVGYTNLTHSEIVAERATGFCIDELRKRGKELRNAKVICEGTFAKRSKYCAGPVAELHVDKSSLLYDASGRTVDITVKWKRPYDVKDGAKISNYLWIGMVDRILIDPNFTGDSNENFWEEQRVEKVAVGKNLLFPIKAKCSNGENGYLNYLKYKIPNACDVNMSIPFCDEKAKCVKSSGGMASSCRCMTGYQGSGLNPKRFGGNEHGCIRTCESFSHDECHKLAKCSEDDGEFSCLCSSSLYFGDGYTNGSGCTHIVVFFIPLFVLLIILGYLIIRKRMKKDTISRFVDANQSFTLLEMKNLNVFGKEWEIDPRDLHLHDVIGRGTFGVVSKATLLKKFRNFREGTQVAVKTAAGLEAESLLMEISLLKSIGEHENILKFIGCSTVSCEFSPVMLVTEYVAYGDLLRFLIKAREADTTDRNSIYCLTEREVYYIGQQVANGMEFLCKMRIIHGDLAARNVLVDKNLVCKISDFGLANDVYRYGAIKNAVEKRVPYKWVSPERMMGGKVPITWRSDVWSFGILLYEIVTLGGAPYPEVRQTDLLAEIESGYRMEKPEPCSDFLYSVMMRCWEWTPSNRPCFKELMSLMKSGSEVKSYVNLQPA